MFSIMKLTKWSLKVEMCYLNSISKVIILILEQLSNLGCGEVWNMWNIACGIFLRLRHWPTQVAVDFGSNYATSYKKDEFKLYFEVIKLLILLLN